MGWKPDLSQVVKTGQRVAVIGAGPAGLACADVLARGGVTPVVFDKYPEIGGLLTFGIPPSSWKRGDAAAPRDLRGDGRGVSPRDRGGPRCHLRRPARRVRCGLPRGRYLQVHEGRLCQRGGTGVYDALPYLIANANRLLGFEKAQADYIDFAGKQVVVLGGGDTAMDCVRTAIRQGADKVICAYRRDEENMPGSKREVKNARERG